jgi:alpha-tubulin suppressor-like RCC1 family protein
VALAAGASHTCALRGGAVWCWGRNECGCAGPDGCGVLGTGDTAERLRPAAVAGLPAALDVEAGVAHSCALLEDGTARCWGCHGSGQLGTGLSGTSTVLPAEVTAPPLAALAAGGWRTCARTVDGEPLCWGDRLVSGGMIWGLAYEPLPVDFPAAERLAVGGDRVCAAGDGRAWCFGENDGGLLGGGTWYSPFANAVRIVSLREPVDVAAGSAHACALEATGEVRCWGFNGLGQAGPGPEEVPEPQRVELGGPAVLLAAGFDASCAVLAAGELTCWGSLMGGRADPYVVDLPAPAVAVAVGGSHTCAATADGAVLCWGRNEDGQLGDGTTRSRLTPAEVAFE